MPRGPFLTPTELCERWSIDRRTLDKLFGPRLPVLRVTARIWRINLADVERYEQQERMTQHLDT